jgi:transposase
VIYHETLILVEIRRRFKFPVSQRSVSMPGKAAKVTVSERQLSILNELRRSKTEAAWVVQRSAIIVLAWEGRLNEEISAEVGLGRMEVGKWRRRWRDAWEDLTLLECSEPRRLRQAIRDTLQDAPRSGCRGKFTAEQVTQILALACEPPELSGRPITHWTNGELRAEIIKRGIVENISVSQVGRYLREAMLQPHRRKMWINTTEKDPATFQRQVEEVCQTYQEASARQATDGTRTVCVDEMTGLQALERNAPDKDVRPDEVAKHEFEYTRHGTTTLIGNWDVVQGAMIAETIGPTRTEPDFVAHIQQTVATQPEVPWVFVVDCLNVHWSATLVEWVAERCEPNRPLGKKRQVGSAQVASHSTGVPVRSKPPNPVRLSAQTQFVAESGRSHLRDRDEKGDATRQLYLGCRPRTQTAHVP